MSLGTRTLHSTRSDRTQLSTFLFPVRVNSQCSSRGQPPTDSRSLGVLGCETSVLRIEVQCSRVFGLSGREATCCHPQPTNPFKPKCYTLCELRGFTHFLRAGKKNTALAGKALQKPRNTISMEKSTFVLRCAFRHFYRCSQGVPKVNTLYRCAIS